MPEYVEREAALRAVHGQRGPCRSPAQNQMLDHLKAAVIRLPAADVAPVVHGRWDDGKCSNCGADIPTDDAHDAIFESECRFCYYCGALMDGGDRDEAD